MADDRQALRWTFDSVAEQYQQARPEYPEELFDTLVRATGINQGARLLEVGCATGKATIPLARQGFRITCIEIGAGLAAAARRNLAAFPNVDVIQAAFETWNPLHRTGFDLVFAATAWHWIDPAVRYQRAWNLLRPAGHLAFWSAGHVFADDGDPFFVEIQEVYNEIGEALAKDATRPRPGALPDQGEQIRQSGLFDNVVLRQFDWQISYSADEYIRLLNTFSGHIAMDAGKRDHLYAEIRRRVARRPDGLLRRHWGAVLHVARRSGWSAVPAVTHTEVGTLSDRRIPDRRTVVPSTRRRLR